MRLLVLTSSFPRHSEDIAGPFVASMARALRVEGHRVDVLAMRGPGALPGPHVRWVPYATPSRERLFFGAGGPENLSSTPSLGLLVPQALASMLGHAWLQTKRHDYDWILAHWAVPGGVVGRALEAITGVRCLVITHSGGVHALERVPAPLGRALASWLARGPMTFVSLEKRARFDALSPARDAVVLPMGFEPTTGEDAPERRDWVCLGRLVPIKGVREVLAAWAELRARAPSTRRLHIIGDGPERAALEAMASPGVVFHGTLVGRRRDALLRRSRFAILGSRREASGRAEGLPVSLLEVMDAGCVPVVGEVPGANVFLEDPRRQRLPEERAPEAWARTMRALEVHPGVEALARAGRARVAPWSWPVYVHRWLEILRRS